METKSKVRAAAACAGGIGLAATGAQATLYHATNDSTHVIINEMGTTNFTSNGVQLSAYNGVGTTTGMVVPIGSSPNVGVLASMQVVGGSAAVVGSIRCKCTSSSACGSNYGVITNVYTDYVTDDATTKVAYCTDLGSGWTPLNWGMHINTLPGNGVTSGSRTASYSAASTDSVLAGLHLRNHWTAWAGSTVWGSGIQSVAVASGW